MTTRSNYLASCNFISFLSDQVKSFPSRTDDYLRVCEEICELVGDGEQPFKPVTLSRIQFLQKKRLAIITLLMTSLLHCFASIKMLPYY